MADEASGEPRWLGLDTSGPVAREPPSPVKITEPEREVPLGGGASGQLGGASTLRSVSGGKSRGGGHQTETADP